MDKTVICYIEKDNKYLMLYRNKKQNDLNKGKYIGIGGHVENNESYIDAIKREVKEETSLTINSLEERGVIYFSYDQYEEEMVVFTSSDFSGEISSCNEGDLSWIDKKDILSLPLWEGDKVFLDYLLKDKKTYFKFKLIYENNKLVKVDKLF